MGKKNTFEKTLLSGPYRAENRVFILCVKLGSLLRREYRITFLPPKSCVANCPTLNYFVLTGSARIASC